MIGELESLPLNDYNFSIIIDKINDIIYEINSIREDMQYKEESD